METIVYECEYLDVHKESLTAYTIAENLFSEVDEEGNGFMMFDKIVNHFFNGMYTMQQYAFIN